MNTPTRRTAVTWLMGTLMLVPVATAAKISSPASRKLDTAERCDVLFLNLLPHDAKCIVSREDAGVFAAVYESPVPEMSHADDRIRWLCLAVKTSSESLSVQVSSDALHQHSSFHPADVSLEIKAGTVEVFEDKLRGHVFQQWNWNGEAWLLAARRSADSHLAELFIEEYNAAQSKVVVTTGRIDQDGFDSVRHYRRTESIDLAKYDGGSIST